MRHDVILMEQNRRTSLTLPVPPPSFEVTVGKQIQTVHLTALGDINLCGLPTLSPMRLDILLPGRDYGFSTADRPPGDYIEQLTQWAEGQAVLRCIITDTPVNLLVLLESVTYGENDGSGDVYATINLRGYREVEEVETVRPKGTAKPRSTPAPASQARTHVVVKNDTMSSLAQKYFGNGGKTYYEALAKANNRSAYAYLYVGEVIKIPPKEQLGV